MPIRNATISRTTLSSVNKEESFILKRSNPAHRGLNLTIVIYTVNIRIRLISRRNNVHRFTLRYQNATWLDTAHFVNRFLWITERTMENTSFD